MDKRTAVLDSIHNLREQFRFYSSVMGRFRSVQEYEDARFCCDRLAHDSMVIGDCYKDIIGYLPVIWRG